MELSDDDKEIWRQWADWDKKRYARDVAIHEKRRHQDDAVDESHVPKKRKSSSSKDTSSIPKKRKN